MPNPRRNYLGSPWGIRGESVRVGFSRVAPRQLDADTRLDGASPLPGQFTYNYAITSTPAAGLRPDLAQQLRPSLRDNLCANEVLVQVLEADMRVVYSYRGSDGGQGFRVSSRKGDCPWRPRRSGVAAVKIRALSERGRHGLWSLRPLTGRHGGGLTSPGQMD